MIRKACSLGSAWSSSSAFSSPLVVPRRGPEVEVVERFIDCFNKHDSDGVTQYCNLAGLAKFKHIDMSLSMYRNEIGTIIKSFPDCTFVAETGVELCAGNTHSGGQYNKAMVKIARLVIGGTHTGEPFGLGSYPAIPTTSIRAELDPEFVLFKVVDGLIEEIHVTPMGPSTGVSGMYQKVGGKTEA